MVKISAGLLLFRRRTTSPEVLLVHPGGPYFRKKDAGYWTIPKGEPTPGEDLLDAARREVEEETGMVARGPFIELQPIRQKGGKVVHAWAFEGDWDPSALRSNTFRITWPPRSGREQEFPEIDRARFFTLDAAKEMILVAQRPLLEELERRLSGERGEES